MSLLRRGLEPRNSRRCSDIGIALLTEKLDVQISQIAQKEKGLGHVNVLAL